ncbi:MAG: capsule assembly Wzi family protein [Candidatus Acidiferrales bacterium]
MWTVRAVMMGWLAINGLTGATGYAAARPQNPPEQPGNDGPAKSEGLPAEEKPKARIKLNAEDQEASLTLPHTVKGLGERFLLDQKQTWTSPAKMRWADANWLLPLSGVTTGLFVTDVEMSRHISHNPTTVSHYNTVSNAAVAGVLGGAGAMWVLSYPKHNDHWRETGFLAGEAVVNSLVVVEAMKYPLGRQRPNEGNGNGEFFHRGVSFPSEHSAAAWAAAGVVAHEYPGPLTKIVVYSLATLVDYSRYRARQHFPSDVFVSSIIGNLVAEGVYNRHHDAELGGDIWNGPAGLLFDDGHAKPGFIGSPYVPLDSWIYPVLDRLAAMGLVDSGFAGMRPWTRLACAEMVTEAADRVDESQPVANELVRDLQAEFRPELGGGADQGETTLRLESVYSRTEHISGMPLTDGYTFAQTQINDFGRPFGEGWSTVNGFSAYASWGPWVAYVRGEEQSTPSIPAFSLATRQIVQQVDFYPALPPGSTQPPVTQFSLLDAYVGMMLSNWQVSFGKQSLWWGPGDGGSMTLSNNAPPINMFRISRTVPLKLPSILSWLGPVRGEAFFGQLSGQEFLLSPSGMTGQFGQSLSPQPFIHGQKISFKPTPNFEFGFFRTTVYGGPGYPLTFHTLIRSLFSTANENAGGASKPGNRTAGMDLIYRLPRLRNWLTFYADGYTDDQFSPVAYADRSAWRAGLYLSQFPLVRKLDLRVEGTYTDNPIGGAVGHGFYYFNGTWRGGYTNNGNLLGSWVGREGQGAQAWSNYWFGTRNRMQFNFRHQKVSHEFIPGGGTLTDLGARGDYWLRSNLGLSASVQYERWLFPAIQPNAQRDVSVTVGIVFQPQKLFQRTSADGMGSMSGNGGRP